MPGRETIRRRPRLEELWFGRPYWYELALWLVLGPASFAYRIGRTARNIFRRRPAHPGWPTRIVSVGNLTVGGNGKTPFTLFLASRLQAQGLSVGILSRGFGRKTAGRGAMLVSDASGIKLTPDAAGDEPVMMAKSFHGPIVVARRRIDGMRLLEQIAKPDVVVLDDAFQHRELYRDVDLVLISSERGFGNGYQIPAGPMREPTRALKRADAAVVVSADGSGRPSALTRRQLKGISRVPVIHASLRPRSLVRIEKGAWVECPIAMAGRHVLAVSGLADPRGFYAMLHQMETDLIGVLEYPDHHNYTSSDWQTIINAAHNADIVLTTEKDMVKLEHFPFMRDSLYALRLEVSLNAEDAATLDDLVTGNATAEDAAARAV